MLCKMSRSSGAFNYIINTYLNKNTGMFETKVEFFRPLVVKEGSILKTQVRFISNSIILISLASYSLSVQNVITNRPSSYTSEGTVQGFVIEHSEISNSPNPNKESLLETYDPYHKIETRAGSRFDQCRTVLTGLGL